jgi:hypothetical protein
MTRTVPSRESRIVKKLPPGAPGTKRLAERFGNALVCVRYRIDEQARRRYTTVELVVADGALPAPPPANVFVRIAYGETELRQKVKSAGGQWHPERKLWRLPRAKARTLGLMRRIEKCPQEPA